MGFDSASLPDRVLKLIPKEQRKVLGKAGQTAQETLAKAEAKNERDLQSQMVSYLRMKGIEVLWHRTDKKSHATIGWPDITAAIIGHDGYMPRVYALAIEVKLPGKYLSTEQRVIRKKMCSHPNHWTCKTLRSIQELKTLLEGLGL